MTRGRSGRRRGRWTTRTSSPSTYTGKGTLTSLTLDGLTAGLIFDPRPFLGQPTLSGALFWQQGFPFTSDAPGVTGRVQLGGERLAISVRGARHFAFGIDRDEATTAYGVPLAGNSADQLGQVVSFPSGIAGGPGMVFTARTSTGRTIIGTLRNRTGSGWTPVDGYGYLNAELAVDH